MLFKPPTGRMNATHGSHQPWSIPQLLICQFFRMAFYVKRAYFVNLSLGKLALCVSIGVSSMRGSHRLTLAADRGSKGYRSPSSKSSNLRISFDASAHFLVALDLIIFGCVRSGRRPLPRPIQCPRPRLATGLLMKLN